jgi:hypothetical protein
MTLKEKAKERAEEIYSKCYIICQEYTEEIQCSIQAKQCALVAVDEILKNDTIFLYVHHLDFWKEVKQEIEKL